MATGVHDASVDRALLLDLSRCCKEGLNEELGKIFDSQRDILKYFYVKSQRGQTLLHEACEADQADIVQLILLNGVPPDIPGKGNVTPLHVSAMKGYVNCVRMLLEADADIRLEDELGFTVFQKAERSKRREPVLRLLRSRELVYHIKSGNLAAVENCLTASQFRSYEKRDITEALLAAVRYNIFSAIPLLIMGGAQLLPVSLPWLNASIESALILAIQQENVKATAYLLLCKASLNSNEAQTIRSLLCEPPQEGAHVPWYIVEVFKLLAGGKMKMDYQIAISILAKNYEATLELLLQTEVDLKRRQVNWGGRKLTLLHSSWIYSIAPWVVGLKLNNNHIKNLPKELFDASQLRRLDLSENILQKVPEQLFGLQSLEYLNLSQNKIVELPPVAKWSPMLQFLDLSSNQLSSLPLSIQYSHIETLNLSKNQFRTVPKCIARMQTLTSLDISSMPGISQLPKEMGQLPNLVTLNLNEVQISDFPSMLLRGGISGHFRARARASKPCSNIRIVVLGNSERGRDYLYQRLKHSAGSGPFQRSVEKVEMISWHFKPLFNKGKFIGNQKLYFNMWLLPGNLQVYPLYPCFFTSSALYLLFYDLDSIIGLRENLRPMLMQLMRYCPGANIAIIMVINEWSSVNEQMLDQRTKALEKYLSSPMFSSLNFHQVVLLAGQQHYNIGHHNVQADVKQRIYDIAINMVWNGASLVSRQYPETYQLIAAAVEKETKRPYRSPVMREHELWTISQAVVPNDPPDQMELPLIVEYLLHTGTILHFPDPNCELDQLYILSPAWLMDVLVLITTAANSSVTQRTSFSASYVNVSQHPICSKADVNNILIGLTKKEFVAPFYRILSRFSIALPISNNQLLIPSLLGRGTVSQNGTYQVGSLRRQLAPKAKALPPDMWPRVLARILYRLAYITSIYPENVALECAVSPISLESSIPSLREVRSNSYILMPRAGNLPATIITRVQSTNSEQDALERNSPIHCQSSSSSQESSIAPRYSAVFRFSMDEGKFPPEIHEGELPVDISDTGDASEDTEDTSFTGSNVALETSDNLQVWSNGIIYENKTFSFSLSSCQSDVSSVEEKGIEIAVSRSKHGTLLLARLSYVISQVIREWFPNFMSSESQNQELTQLALCPHCISEAHSSVTTYLVDACVHGMSEGEQHMKCRHHAETVPLSELIPDFMMLDFPPSYHLNDLQINEENIIHQSSHHKLFSGSYRNLGKIAIKQYIVLKQEMAKPLLQLRQEVVMLSQLQHPNIVTMYGFSVLQYSIVLEKAPLGTLHSKLTDYDEKISRVLRFHIACQIASALVYLHHHKIVYRTLKASSILLWSMDLKCDTTVKLTNFNRACFLSPTGHLEKNNFEAYHAPEMLKYNFKEEYTNKVDIYSYGLLLYELVTRWAAFEGSLLPDRIVVNQRPKLSCINTAGYGTLVEMMQQCWQDDIQARPEAFSLVKELRPLEYQCFLCSQVVRDCVSVRGCCLAQSSRQIWVYGEDENGTQVFILNDEDLSIRGTLHLKARATSICAIDNKVVIGLTENCAHAYDAASFRFTDRLSLQDSVTAIAANDTFVFVGLANGVLICYSKLQFPKEPHEILIHNAPIFSMVAISDHMWVTCGNKIFILNADDSVMVAKSWDGCLQGDEVYSIAVSENQALVWSITRDACCVMSWDVNTCECLHKYDLAPQLTNIFDHIHLSASYTRQLLCIERSKDTLWFGLSCGVIAIFTATKEPELIAFFRAHRSSSKCLKAIQCANERRGISSMMISGGFGEMSSLGSYISQKHGYVMLWEALSADEYKLLEKRSREV